MSEVRDPEDKAASAPAEPQDDTLTTAKLAGAGDASAEPSPAAASPAPSAETTGPLLARDEARDFQTRWDGIQASFVDEPRQAVEQADNLVANAMQRLAEVFAAERANLEGQWDRGDSVSTEDLRVALRRYRSFFGRLLAF